jgi:CheY-like chemotaxis protein
MDERIPQILLVEDDHVDVMNMQRAFKKLNINNPLNIAFNGIEALNMLRGTNGKPKLVPAPQIIITDINMPKMNGIEFIRELRNDPEFSTISIFVITTSNDSSDKVNAFNLNVAGYILKPLSFEKFVNTISILNNYWNLCEHPDRMFLAQAS